LRIYYVWKFIRGLQMRNSRRERFVELAEKRVSKSVHQIKLIGNLADKSNYEYSDEDARKMISALRTAVDECEQRYLHGGKDQEETFKL